MSKVQKQPVSNYEKPFASQEELRNAIIDKFSKYGSKVKYKLKITIK